MKDFTDDILAGTAMENVQIIKSNQQAVQVIEIPKQEVAPIIAKSVQVASTTKKRGRKKKLADFEFIPNPDAGNRRGKDYATIRMSKEFTQALKVLFDDQKMTLIMDTVVCAYLNQHKAELAEKYNKILPFG